MKFIQHTHTLWHSVFVHRFNGNFEQTNVSMNVYPSLWEMTKWHSLLNFQPVNTWKKSICIAVHTFCQFSIQSSHFCGIHEFQSFIQYWSSILLVKFLFFILFILNLYDRGKKNKTFWNGNWRKKKLRRRYTKRNANFVSVFMCVCVVSHYIVFFLHLLDHKRVSINFTSDIFFLFPILQFLLNILCWCYGVNWTNKACTDFLRNRLLLVPIGVKQWNSFTFSLENTVFIQHKKTKWNWLTNNNFHCWISKSKSENRNHQQINLENSVVRKKCIWMKSFYCGVCIYKISLSFFLSLSQWM